MGYFWMLLSPNTNALHSLSSVLWHRQTSSPTWISSLHWLVCAALVLLARSSIKCGASERPEQHQHLSETLAVIWSCLVSCGEGNDGDLDEEARGVDCLLRDQRGVGGNGPSFFYNAALGTRRNNLEEQCIRGGAVPGIPTIYTYSGIPESTYCSSQGAALRGLDVWHIKESNYRNDCWNQSSFTSRSRRTVGPV